MGVCVVHRVRNFLAPFHLTLEHKLAPRGTLDWLIGCLGTRAFLLLPTSLTETCFVVFQNVVHVVLIFLAVFTLVRSHFEVDLVHVCTRHANKETDWATFCVGRVQTFTNPWGIAKRLPLSSISNDATSNKKGKSERKNLLKLESKN